MREGRFEDAWHVSDRMLTLPPPARDRTPRHLQRIWDGRALGGRRVLVRCYHGLGDTIQFIRYVPLLHTFASEVIVWAQPVLLPLLRSMDGIDRLLPLHDGEPGVAYDADVEVMELPYVFRTTVESIPGDVPYLQVTAGVLERPLGPAVGLVWRAGNWAADRSIPFEMLRPLLNAPVTWYILQHGDGLAECPPAFGVHLPVSTVIETAAVVAGLDRLVTVDSMPAHLAGALGVPVWTLLKAAADWRWMETRDDSPWYPSMRLFRQEEPGAWGPIIARAAGLLTV
jgi:hypothetical protein